MNFFWKAEFKLIVWNGDFGMTLNVGDGIWKALVGDGCVYFPPPRWKRVKNGQKCPAPKGLQRVRFRSSRFVLLMEKVSLP